MRSFPYFESLPYFPSQIANMIHILFQSLVRYRPREVTVNRIFVVVLISVHALCQLGQAAMKPVLLFSNPVTIFNPSLIKAASSS